MTDWLVSTSAQWLAALAAGTPLLLAALWKCRWPVGAAWPLALLGLFFWAALALAHSGQAFQALPSPWQGMLFEAVFALAVILAGGAAVQSGLTARIPAAAWRDCLIATALLLGFVAARSAGLRVLGLSAGAGAVGMEYLLYQATLPGIAEELAYRGVIQTGLNRLFGRDWRVLGAQVGWGWVITSVLFWGIHAFRMSPETGFVFYWPALTMQLWAGIVFGWLRERSGSIIPGVIAHNGVNLVWTLV